MSDFYAVRTTGVVCRVGCASRAPRPENISWFDTVEAAQAAGFRACRRCRPDADHPQDAFRAGTVRKALAYLRWGLTVADTAARVRVSERHLRRLVQQETGKSPREAVPA